MRNERGRDGRLKRDDDHLVDLALDNLEHYIERYGSLGVNSVCDILRDEYDIELSFEDLEYVEDMMESRDVGGYDNE